MSISVCTIHTRVCKENRFRATIFLHDEIHGHKLSFQKIFKNLPSRQIGQSFVLQTSTSKKLCIVHTLFQFLQFPRNRGLVDSSWTTLFLRDKISLPFGGTHIEGEGEGEGSIRANRSKVRHLNNLFLVLPFPCGGPVVAREGASRASGQTEF